MRLIPRFALGFSLLIFALGSAAPFVAAQDAAGERTAGIAMPAPISLDPTQLSRFDLPTRDLVENLFVGLTRFNPQTQQVEPMLAQSWEVSANGLTWTFALREDISWVRADGSGGVEAVRPVVAGDFVYAVQRACDPLRPSPLTANLMVIRGCKTVASAFPEVVNDLFIAREIGVRATGPHTLEIDVMFESGFLPTLLAMPELRPLARETAADDANWTRARSIMSNGPFALAEWSSSGLALVRNPHWPDDLVGNVERITAVFSSDTRSPAALVASGHAHYARLDDTQVADARIRQPDLVQTADGTSILMVGFSYDRAIVDTAEGRRALSYALDRDMLATQLFPDEYRAADGLTPSNVVAAPAAGRSLFDPALARRSFAAAGFENCANVPEPLILLVPNDDQRWVELGTAIGQQWADALGCSPRLFEVRSLSRTLMIDLAHATYDPEKVTRSHMWLATWHAEYPDANAWVSDALHCQYGYVRNVRECENADALMDRAALLDDGEARAQLYRQAEDALFGAAGSFPVAPLLRSVAAWLQTPDLTGVVGAHPARFDLWLVGGAAAD